MTIERLAAQALTTPDPEAPDALEVLVDALLEAGLITQRTNNELREDAYHWARRKLVRRPSPTEVVFDLVARALEEEELPLGIVGIVQPHILRVHFLEPIDAQRVVRARESIARRLPSSVVVEITMRDGPTAS